ncbi:phage antirepressor KilAC domain-containing protein [Edaphobacillus lindanitolerans]|uniref:Anti-repressor protein n=1 Tax=Edaphobacillus lindanitolerans TaxID=550447 RepID=A0A1U7PSP4_9BACI|nr:phage antirepressor KilAC domain-containing protein [Edaphobacillus lindanitolerans]SIT91504.1 anti-repressor protein [Edaphobacillus lindanitolerans]
MSQLQNFQHNVFGDLPLFITDNTEWFGAVEAAKALSFSNPHAAIRTHVDDDDLTVHEVTDRLGRRQRKKFVNESGLYNLIFGASRQGNNDLIRQKAKQFRRWVTSEVLPAVRKHGGYLTPEKVEEVLLNPDTIIRLATDLKNERAQKEAEMKKRIELEEKVKADEKKVFLAEAIQVSENAVLIKDLATVLTQNGVPIGQNRLFKILREKGYLLSSKAYWNKPSQRAMEMKLFEVSTRLHTSSDGSTYLKYTPKVTGRGQLYFINKFLKSKQIG